uniref:Uncharacterized protein n=1 Tax=Panagrolaimus sp. JU765 TaxID=591449 RepID=A0AC34RN36_9BILA
MPTLVHGFRVNESTFNEFKEIAEKNFQNFLANFLVFMEPLNLFKDKLIQKQNTILIPQEEDEEEKIMLEKKKKEKNEKEAVDEKTMNGIGKNKEKVVKGKEKKLSAEGNEKEGEKLKKDDKNKKVKDETETKIEEDDEEEDELFNEMFEQVAIDFRLLQMIRMGML